MKQAVAYIRESTERQAEGYSPDAQRHAIEKFAGEKGYALIGEYFDAMSGTKEQRPGWQSLMEAAERQEFEAVLVFHSTRWGRDWRVTPYYTKRLMELNVVVVFLDINAEPGSDEAEVMEWANSFVAAQYSRMLSRFTRAGIREKRERGGHVGFIPVGLDRNSEGTLAPNGDAELVAEAFQRCATGEHVVETGRWLREQGLRTRRKALISHSGAQVVLHNHLYVETGVVDEELFERVQRALTRRQRGENKPKRYRTYPFGGLLRCAACGSRMRGRFDHPYKEGTQPVMRYVCYGPGDHRTCPARTKIDDSEASRQFQGIMGYVGEAITAHWDDLVTALKAEQPSRKRERGRVEAQLQRLKDLYELGDIERSEYLEKRDRLNEESEAVPSTELPPRMDEIGVLLGDLGSRWETMELTTKRAVAWTLMREATVDNGTVTSLLPTPDLFLLLTHLKLKEELAATGSPGSKTNGMKPYGFAFSSTRAPSTHSSNTSAVHTSTTSMRSTLRDRLSGGRRPNASSTSSAERW